MYMRATRLLYTLNPFCAVSYISANTYIYYVYTFAVLYWKWRPDGCRPFSKKSSAHCSETPYAEAAVPLSVGGPSFYVF